MSNIEAAGRVARCQPRVPESVLRLKWQCDKPFRQCPSAPTCGRLATRQSLCSRSFQAASALAHSCWFVTMFNRVSWTVARCGRATGSGAGHADAA